MEVPINRYFHDHPEMVLGTWSRKDRLYGGEQGFSVEANGVLEDQLRAAVGRLPEFGTRAAGPSPRREAPAFTPPPLERHVTEGSFFVGDDRTIFQIVDGQAGAGDVRRDAPEGDRHHDREAARGPRPHPGRRPARLAVARTRAGPRDTATRPGRS